MEAAKGPITRRERLDWVALRLVPGVGGVTFARLLEAFGSPGAALGAPLSELSAVPRLARKVAEAVHGRETSADPERELARLEEMGARALTLADPEYPPLLRAVYAPPPVIFVRGELAPAFEGGVGVVGSRNVSPYGKKVAAELAQSLAHAGKSLISGLARGVDGAAHMAALEAGGHTVGVVGCGLDITYPPEHQALTKRMAADGAVVSEFPLGTKPQPGNFPVRNRVISGLAAAVVVVEAGLKSGALITARHAFDQGREVFAVPGPIHATGSAGCHEMIRRGARLYTGPHDLLAPGALPPSAPADRPTPAADDLPAEAVRLMGLLGPEPVHVDLLARQSGLAPQEVTALLVTLELAGRVAQTAGKHYVLA